MRAAAKHGENFEQSHGEVLPGRSTPVDPDDLLIATPFICHGFPPSDVIQKGTHQGCLTIKYPEGWSGS